ncbi:MAG: zinc ribbon domain-containing protein [Deltaproteobacteria bacterium]|jgi:putative FmdB family regulatory protein|nr:zinc ribbon domain-containing protein [Deltaproteobacteria bacterium]
MPIYEYECAQCHQVTEALQKFSDRPLTECPRCGGPLSKLMSMNSFQLKGGGWYVTDYANKKSDPAPKAASPAAGESADKKAAPKAADPAPAAKPAKEAAAPASKA